MNVVAFAAGKSFFTSDRALDVDNKPMMWRGERQAFRQPDLGRREGEGEWCPDLGSRRWRAVAGS